MSQILYDILSSENPQSEQPSPMPNAQCPMPNAQCPITHIQMVNFHNSGVQHQQQASLLP